jgi:hypothetical protein
MAFVINSWELVHPFPIVTHSDGEATAHVRYGGREAILPVDFRPVSSASHSYERDRLTMNGFAARFPKGRRIWNARLEWTPVKFARLYEDDGANF